MQDDISLLDRIESGEFPAAIARQYGVTKQAIYKRFRGRQDYQQARELGAEARVDEAVDAIREAVEPVSLARAREHFKAVAWQAEREFPHRWGQRTHVTVEHTGDLGERLRRSKERTIEHEASYPQAETVLLPNKEADAQT